MKYRYLATGLAAVLTLLGSLYVRNALRETATLQETQTEQARSASREGAEDGRVIVIDAGHGGEDPGKIGVNQALEKEINLSIAKRCKLLLEQNGYLVYLTREGDADLAEAGSKNRKAQDMRARISVLQEKQPVLGISIHQNSYPSESCRGAQVFYLQGSAEGKRLAQTLQKQLKSEIKDGNTRQAKADASYYLLKHAPCPFVIVECGFLSNREEAELLLTEEYQEKVAFAVHLGVIEYMNTEQEME